MVVLGEFLKNDKRRSLMRNWIKSAKRLSIIGVLSFIVFFGITMIANNTVSVASTSPYLIKVNKKQNVITIYEKDSEGKFTVPVKVMVCSTGPATPTGSFSLGAKYKWKLMVEEVWSQYATRIKGDILFHSVWYYKQDPATLSARQYNKLGISASHGCIRLTVADAKWIQDNCPSGTKVKIFNSKKVGPLDKPVALKLLGYTGWDPTDVTNPENPFNNKKPRITGAKDKTIAYGKKVNLKKGIKAYSTAGTEITSSLKITGKVDSFVAGVYKIKYKIVDAMGRKTSKTITYTVQEDVRKPVFKGVKKTYLPVNTVVDEALVLKGVSAKAGSTKLDPSLIKVKISLQEDTANYTWYKVKYTITSPTSKITTTKTTSFIIDKLAPTIAGITDRYLVQEQLDTYIADPAQLRLFALEGVTCADEFTKVTNDKIEIALNPIGNGNYTLTYTLKDNVGNIFSQACNVILLKDPKLVVIQPYQPIAVNQVVTELDALNNVKFTANGQDYTIFKPFIKVNLVSFEGGYYANYSLTLGSKTFYATVTYSVIK